METKKMFNELKDEFLLGKRLAEERVIMARGQDASVREISKWVKDYDFLLREDNSVGEKFAGLFGYAFGDYTTYCPTQLQLDFFDKEADWIRKGVVSEYTGNYFD
ncbi:MAG: hypothetical protein AABX88_01440 [Nanoarchaeota archaeon]